MAAVVESTEHIVVEQQRTGHLVGIGVGRRYSWHRTVVQIAYAEEAEGGTNSQDCVPSIAHSDNYCD